jgi:flagellar hook-length control protein FliK
VQPGGKDTSAKAAGEKKDVDQTKVTADAAEKAGATNNAKDRAAADVKDKETSLKVDSAGGGEQSKSNETDAKAAPSTSAADVNGQSPATEEKAGLDKEVKQVKGSQAGHPSTEANGRAQQGTPDGNERRVTAEAAAATTDPTSATSAQTESTVAASVADAKAKLSESDSKDGTDSHHEDKASVDANTHNEAPAATNNANTTAVANLTVPTIPSATPDLDKLKGGGDQSTKAVTAKTETAVGPLGRTLRETTDLTRGASSSNSTDTPQVDPARFVSRVVKAVQTANDRGGPLQLRLSPPELGSLKIQLTVKDGVMSASLEADNVTTRRLLLDHLPTLRDRLAEQNIRVDRFDVDVKQENNGQPNSAGSGQNPYQQQAQQPEPRRSNTPQQSSEPTVVETPVAAPRISSTGINLVV